MLSKNNYNEKLRKMSARKERFSIRKFAVGAASVMIGLTLFGVGSQSVKADTTDDGGTVTSQNETSANGDVSNNTDPASTDNDDQNTTNQENVNNNNTGDGNTQHQVANSEESENTAGTLVAESAEIPVKSVKDSNPTNTDKLNDSKITVKNGKVNVKSLVADLADNGSGKQGQASKNAKSTNNDVLATKLAKETTASTTNSDPDQNKDNFVTGDWQLGTLDTTNNTIAVTGYTGAKSGKTTTTEYYIPNAAAFRADTSLRSLGVNDDTQVTIDYDVLRNLVTNGATKIITETPASEDDIKKDQLKVTGSYNNYSGNLTFMLSSKYNGTTSNDWSTGTPRNSPNNTLKNVDVSGLNVAGYTALDSIFADDQALATVKGLGYWDISNANNVGHMFYNDISLTDVEGLNQWDTSNLHWIDNMFNVQDVEKGISPAGKQITVLNDIDTTPKLKALTLNWTNLPNVYGSQYMFAGQSALTTIGNQLVIGQNGAGHWSTANNMFDGSGIKQLYMSGSSFSTGTNNVTDMFANLQNQAVFIMNDVENAGNLKASDFAGDKPLVVISNTLNADTLNKGTVTDGTGHPANKITINYTNGDTPTNTTTTTVSGVQSNFVYSSADDLDNIKKLVAGKTGNDDLDKVIANGAAATLTAGYNNANVNSNTASDIDKVMGTYAISQYQDVTQSEIDDGSYPDADKKTATYNVVERFPDTYTGEGTMSATDYAAAIGDTNVSKYEGYVYKIIANQTVTAYETATKNLITGAVTYSTPYNSKYLDFSTTTDNDVNGQPLWSHKYSNSDETLISNAPVDTPTGYTISANPQSYATGLKDNRNTEMLQISYDPTTHTFHYDFMNGTSDGNALANITFNTLPDSYNFYIDYAAKDQKAPVEYIDTDNGNAVVDITNQSNVTKEIDGKTDETITLSDSDFTLPENYELVPDNPFETSYTFGDGTDANPNKTIQVKVRHKTQDVTQQLINDNYQGIPTNNKGVPVDDKGNPVEATATYQIIEKRPASYGGDETLIKQVVTTHKVATKDLVTGKITYSKDYSMKYTTVENSGTEANKFPEKDYTTAYNITYDESFPGYTTNLFKDYNSDEKGTNPGVSGGSGYSVLSVTFGTQDGKSVINYDFMVGGSLDGPTFSALPASRDFVISYTPVSHASTVTFKDAQGNTIGTPVEVTGDTDTTQPVNATVPAGWKLSDGQSIPENIPFTYGADGQPTFEKNYDVTIEHNTITLTPEQVENGNLPEGTVTSDDYPTPGKVPEDAKDVTKTVTRTIKVTKPGETQPTTTEQKANFTRNVTIDLVDGSSTYGAWTGSDKWDAFTPESIPGYDTVIKPANSNLGEVTPAADDSDETIDITYAAKPQSITITYQTADGTKVDSATVSGKTGDTNVPTNSTVPAGYKIVSGTVPTTVDFTYNGDTPNFNDATITVEPIETTVQPTDPKDTNEKLPDNPDKNYPEGVQFDDLNKTIKRTITANTPEGVQDLSQSLTFQRTATVNEATGEVTGYSDWTPVANGDDDFNVVYAPEFPGYTPSQASVAEKSLTNDEITNWKDTPVTINYTPDQHTTKIVYQDEDGNPIKTDTVTGNTGDNVSTNSTVPAGWTIKTGSVPSTIDYTYDGENPNFPDTVTVTIEHAKTTVQPTDPKTPTDTLPDNPGKKYPTGVSESDLNKTVVRTINVTKPDGSVTTTTQTTKLSRTATVDEVTGDVTYSDWTISQDDTNENKTGWLEFNNVPEVAGYTPSQTSVDPVTDVNTLLEGNKTVNITYSPNDGNQAINYVDEDGNTIHTQNVSGKTDQTVGVTSEVPAGWVVVDEPDNKVPDKVTIKPDSKPINVVIKHATTTIQPTDPKTPGDTLPDNPDKKYPSGVSENDLNKTVTRTITVTNPDGTSTTTKQTTKLTRTATVDEVTGKVTYSDWGISGDNGWTDFDDVPEVAGYTPNQTHVDPVTDVKTLLKGDTEVNISYIPNKNTVGINYVDEQGNVVHTQKVEGETDQTVTGIKSEVPAGWELVPGQKVPSEVKIPADSSTFIPVKIQHKSTVVTYEDPKSTSDPLPDNPDKKYPEGVTKDDLYREVTRTINVEDPVTHVVTKTYQRVELTRTATVDEVNGNVTYSSWNIQSGSWPEFTTPDQAGYTPSQAGVSPVTDPAILANNGDQTVNITYTANPQSTKIIYQDENGNQIGDPTTVTGVTGQTIDPSKYVKAPAGYEITGTVPTSYTFKADGNGNIIVTVAAIPPYVPEPDDGDVTVIVNYKDKDGNIISSETITGKPGETITVGTNIPAGYTGSSEQYTIPEGGGVVDIAVTKDEEKPAKGDESKPDDTKTDTDVTSAEPTKKQAKHKKAKKTSNYSSNTGVKGAGLDHESNIGAKGTDLNKGPKAAGTESATAPKGEYMKSNDKTLPQTGEDDTKAAGLLGTILAAMGITTAFGAKKRRKQD